MKKTVISAMIVLVTALVSGCGGGGGGDTPPITQPTTAVVKLATAVTGSIPPGTIISGYDLTITLPAGVTVKSASPPEPDAGVVTATGEAAGSYITANYTAATLTSAGSLKVVLVSPNANGINAGEFSTIVCDIAADTNPASTDFTATAFKVSGLVTTPTTATVDLTSELSLSATATLQ